VLRDREEFSESFLDKVNIFLVVLNSTSNDDALLRCDVVHDELLNHASIDVVEVMLETKAGHTEGIVSISSSEEEILVVREGIIFVKVLVKIVGLLVLGAGNVGGHD
jgi:hypothetical protein